MEVFSTYIHECKNLELANKLYIPCKNILKQIEPTKKYQNGKTTFFDMEIIKVYKEFEELYDWIFEEVNNYLNILESDIPKLKIIDIWISEMFKNGKHELHVHTPYSIFSGNFYVTAPENSADLTFRRHDWNNNIFNVLENKNYNKYNCSSVKCKSEKGKMLIFPSSLPHEVINNQSDSRIAISYNIGLDI